MTDLHDSKWYINRELSWLAFNERVLCLAEDSSLPLLERLRFLFISSGNLDEFFEIRVAGVKQQIAVKSHHRGADGLLPEQVLQKISHKAHELVDRIYQVLNHDLIDCLAKEQIHLMAPDDWDPTQAQWIEHYFEKEVLPVISPIALDLAHPFPQLANKSLNFIVRLKGKDAFGRKGNLAIVHVPRSIPRAILAPKDINHEKTWLFFLTSIIHAHVEKLFPGMEVGGCYQFRITRNSDLFLDEEEIEDLALALKTSLFSRHYGNAVRLEIDANCPDDIANYLLQKHQLTTEDMYRVNGPVNITRFMMIMNLIDRPDLHYPPFTPKVPQELKQQKDIFAAIREMDILMHHPYQSFDPVLALIHQATVDPNVLAIKQTLYRTGAESKIVNALVEAARAGKEVTAIIELRARFDEASNIELANRLQAAGALVVYGVVGYKTHAKMILIVRRENNQLKRYVHLGTGNYHARIAREYTDFGLLTYDQTIGEDVHAIFQELTGMGNAAATKKLIHSPFSLDAKFHQLIDTEIDNAKNGLDAKIIAKINAITDEKIIRKLYQASQAGVSIDLIVRGICSLRPGIKGISENIRVRSVLGRFLEHSRFFYFYQNGQDILYCGSADWMERNLYHRVEVCFPIDNPHIKATFMCDIFPTYFSGENPCWTLQGDGSYLQQPITTSKGGDIQEAFINGFAE